MIGFNGKLLINDFLSDPASELHEERFGFLNDLIFSYISFLEHFLGFNHHLFDLHLEIQFSLYFAFFKTLLETL
ncbi:hypothetical protein D3C76_1681910 [compost metagenome]